MRATIRGVVLAPSGEPARATLIAALHGPTVSGEGAVIVGRSSVSTDSGGGLSLSVEPGRYTLTLAMRGSETLTRTVDLAGGGVYGLGTLFGIGSPVPPSPPPVVVDGDTFTLPADSDDGMTFVVPETASLDEGGMTYTMEETA